MPLAELMPGSEEDPEWLGGAELNQYAENQIQASRDPYVGAAGATTHDMEKRIQAERELAPHKLLGAGNSSIDDMLCGRDLDNSEADDHLEDQASC